MMNAKEKLKISKFLSLVLRHKPEIANIYLDLEGWCLVDDLIPSLSDKFNIDLLDLEHIVSDCRKQRFSFSEDGKKIRANQGHSISVEIEHEEKEPPNTLFHGTQTSYIESIKKSGLEKRNRLHVHLSKDIETAKNVGSRRGKNITILNIDSERMYEDGFKFFLSKNGVWLIDYVPPQYIKNFT